MAKVEISQVVITIGDKEIKLSLAEAKELMQVLNDTLADEPTTFRYVPYIERMVPYPVPVPNRWYTPSWTYTLDNTVYTKSVDGMGATLSIVSSSSKS